MKSFRRFFQLLILSIVIAIEYYFFVLDNVVKSSFSTKVGEIVVVTIPVFVIVVLLYVVGRIIVKSAKGISKKNLPNQEGQNR